MADFRMPALGADMEEGTIIEWRIRPGDSVRRGDIVAVVDTSKAEIEIEIFDDAVIDQLVVPVGERVPVGAVIATFTPSAAETPAPTAAAAAHAAAGAPPGAAAGAPPPVPAAPPPATAAPPPVAEPAGAPLLGPVGTGAPEREGGVAAAPAAVVPRPARRRVSPLARRIAAERGVDLRALQGSGPRGAIVRADVERAAACAAPAEAPAAVARPAPEPPPTRYAAMWRATGALMARSKREIPHYYLRSEIDLSRALSWLERANAGRALAERIIPAALLLRAVALGAREVPELNGFWVDDAFQPAGAVHLGVAISLRHGGLAAPALLHAERKPLPTLMRELRDLVRRTRAGKLRASEMSEPTLTVTNLGDQGVESVFGVIYPPQVALVGFGIVTERPFAAAGMVGARPLVTATLAGDHRASDGHRGARFLSSLERLLQEPEKL